MAKAKSDTKEKETNIQLKDSKVVLILKVLGVFVTIFGFYSFTMLCITGVLSNVNVLIGKHFDSTYAILEVAKQSFTYITIYMGIVLFYELINYITYLYNARLILLMSLVVESITLLVFNIIEGFDAIQLYIIIVPILTGIINYFILLINSQNKEV